jgi:hypothetical protein
MCRGRVSLLARMYTTRRSFPIILSEVSIQHAEISSVVVLAEISIRRRRQMTLNDLVARPGPKGRG